MKPARRTVGFSLVFLFLAWALAEPMWAPPPPALYIYEVLLDTDDDTTTGGPVSVVQGNEPPHDEVGIDYIVRVLAEAGNPFVSNTASPTVGASVSAREIYRWTGSMFNLVDTDPSTYPLGMSDGHGLVEFGAPMTVIGNPQGVIRGVFHAQRTLALDGEEAFEILLRLLQRPPSPGSGVPHQVGVDRGCGCCEPQW